MRAHHPRRNIVPPLAGRQVLTARGVHGIENAIVLLARFAADQQQHLAVAVVDEAVANASARRERSQITDLTVLRGLPLKELMLDGCGKAHNYAALTEIPTLETLVLPDSFRSLPDED